jgi:hypothetical protein
MGVTVLAASGDDGAVDGTSRPTVDFLAASPYVIGCGGTKLTLLGTSIHGEQSWNELSANEGATGDGGSEVFALPNYHQSARVPPALNGFSDAACPMWQPRLTRSQVTASSSTGSHRSLGGERGRTVVGWASRANQPSTGEKCRLREFSALLDKCRGHVSRYYVRQQRALRSGTGLGRLHRPR